MALETPTIPDLFLTPELIPENISAVLEEHNCDEDQYQELAKTLEKVEKLGYTFDYYLDAEPFNLNKIEDKK